MNNIEHNPPQSKARDPKLAILFLLIFTLGGYFVSMFIALLILLLFNDFDMESIQEIAEQATDKSNWAALITVQAAVAIIAFILSPLAYLYFFENKNISRLFNPRASHLKPVLLTILGTICLMFVNTIFIEWNQNIDLPDAFSGFEQWAQQKELAAEQLTKLLTTFDSFGQFLIGVLVMAIIPAIGEELLFRGMLQRQLQRMTGNAHLAIWISAFVFGFIHLQFYGMLPRMLLGALFGYLYVWSGSLLLPMLAHFVNNALTLILLYSYQTGQITYDVQEAEPLNWFSLLPLFALGIACMVFVKKYFKGDKMVAETTSW